MDRVFLKQCQNNNLEGVNDYLKDFYETLCEGLKEACQYGNPAIVSRLVQVPGLDINYQDRDGFTAAILASNKGHTECVRTLAETDRVDWNKRNRSGQTPLYW